MAASAIDKPGEVLEVGSQSWALGITLFEFANGVREELLGVCDAAFAYGLGDRKLGWVGCGTIALGKTNGGGNKRQKKDKKPAGFHLGLPSNFSRGSEYGNRTVDGGRSLDHAE